MQFDATLIDKMKQVAEENPQAPIAMANPKCLWENVDFGEESLSLMLTMDLHPNVKMWHLTVGRSNHTAAPQNIVDQVVQAVLGNEKIQQIPDHLFPPELRFMKQYVKLVE